MQAIELERIETGLRAMGLLYGSADQLRESAAQAADAQGLVRAYIMRGRPHLLAAYDLEEVIAMVLAAGQSPGADHPGIEQFHPR